MAAHPGLPLPEELLRPELWVAEVVYRPLETELLKRARELGCRTLDGGGMAVMQAAGAFELFTGVAPDRERMLRHFADADAEAGRRLMRRSIATVCLSGTLDEKLEAAAAAGFDGVELFEADLINSPLRPGEVRERAESLGLTHRPLPAVPRLRGGSPAQLSATCAAPRPSST